MWSYSLSRLWIVKLCPRAGSQCHRLCPRPLGRSRSRSHLWSASSGWIANHFRRAQWPVIQTSHMRSAPPRRKGGATAAGLGRISFDGLDFQPLAKCSMVCDPDESCEKCVAQDGTMHHWRRAVPLCVLPSRPLDTIGGPQARSQMPCAAHRGSCMLDRSADPSRTVVS